MFYKFVKTWFVAFCVLAAVPVVGAPAAPVQTDQERLQELRARETQLQENISTAEELLAGQLDEERRTAITGQLERWQNTLRDVQAQIAGLDGGAAAGGADNPNAEEIRRLRRRMTAILERMKERSKEIERLRLTQPTQPTGPAGEGGTGNEGDVGVDNPAGEGDTGTTFGGPPAGGAAGGRGFGGDRLQRLLADQGADFMELKRLQAQITELEGERKPTDAFDHENIPELNPLMLYAGDTEGNPFQPTLGSWGSGIIEETEYGIVQGLNSLLVYTDGFYRGGRIDFANPPEIGLYFEKPEISYLQFDVYFFPDTTATTGGLTGPGGSSGMPGPGGLPMPGSAGAGFGPGGPGMPGPGGLPMPGSAGAGFGPGSPGVAGGSGGMPGSAGGGIGPGAPPGPGGMAGGPGLLGSGGGGGVAGPGLPGFGPTGAPPGVGGLGTGTDFGEGDAGIMNEGPGAGLGPGMGPGMTATGAKQPPKTRSLRLVLYTDRGPIVVEDFYFDWQYEVNPGWTRVFIPVTEMINISERVPTRLERIAIFGDTTDEFYIGMMRMVADEVPLEPEILGAEIQQAIAGEEFQLQTVLESGLSILKYVWDWGDGEITESDTPFSTHLYVKPGDYTVTVTVKDTDELKADGRATVKIKVIPFSDRPTGAPAGTPLYGPGAGAGPGAGSGHLPPGGGGVDGTGNDPIH